MSEFYIPGGAGEAELTEKRSRFLGHVRPAETEEEARAFVAEMKKTYHDARHNCWCYLLRDGVERYSDDGEPQGSAGLPMLEVFRREGVTNAVCVVTRYFGGVLLGTGGLLRAYTQSAKDALDAAGVSVVRRWKQLRLRCPYALLERVKLEAEAFDAVTLEQDYGAEVTLTLLLPEARAEDFSARIFDLSAGRLKPEPAGETLRPAPWRAPK
ncbi:MAG: YigZ family protein [Oscillospiraceae bacterium]|nr:YigZ family protein [Oscillospiraceae bacterium]